MMSEPAFEPLPTQSRRDELIRKAIPQHYSPIAHLLFPSLLGLGTALLSLLLLKNLRLVELWTVPITLFLALGVEWRAHKDLLHRRLPPFSELYERHERFHHVIYTHEDMAMRSPQEMFLVLMPWFAIVLVAAVQFPMVALTYWLTSRNCALLVLCTSLMFFVSYEWLHLCYHLQPEHPIARLGFIRRLSSLHRTHHNPRNMKRWNFNVTIPLFDVFHRSLKSD